MWRIGFSTGALAKSDFRLGIRLQERVANAIELSALREDELDELIGVLSTLDLSKFDYVSFHAPSRRVSLSESELVEKLLQVSYHIPSIVVHPDVIEQVETWRPIEEFLVIENMDQRKPVGRTARELSGYFQKLPKARFCFDLGHARQIDPTLCIAIQLLRCYGDRLAQVHISEVDASSAHVAISSIARDAYRELAGLIPPRTPVIVESVVAQSAIKDELEMAKSSLGG